MTIYYNDCDIAVKKILARVGKNLTIGVPLGIGKPIGLLNAFYRLASEDKSIHLTILTGLTLTRPQIHNDLEKRFITPILEKLLGDYEDPLYEKYRKKEQLPKNIKIIEFFLTPGKYLKNKQVQQNYISTTYTNAVNDILNHSINIIAQQVAYSSIYPDSYSLSCNTDLFYEVTKKMEAYETKENKIAIVAEVNNNLPFMLGNAIIKADKFSEIVDTKIYRSLFSLSKPKLSIQDYLIGLYTSTLIKDGSCLQIGIGKLGDAIASALILRHKENALYQDILKKLQVANTAELTAFKQGLYASTELLTDSYLHLYNEKILKKKVYDHIGLQKLLNSNKITEDITENFLDILVANKIINSKLTEKDVKFLYKFGIINNDIPYAEIISTDLTSSEAKNKIINYCLGKSLQSGKIIHAGFFLGSIDFYQQLKNLSFEELHQIEMTSISRTNTLCWSHKLSTLQRQHARFINAAMMVTVEGTIISDGLNNWQEVSGVGGQFDFAVMAQELPEARFIINCHSTRYNKGKIDSNVVWSYQNITLPRYLRDIIITEYGIADCRSKTDSEIIKTILNVTDSRFQEKLLKKAKQYGKMETSYEIPKLFQNNTPESIQPIIEQLQLNGYGKPYPFGSALTAEEQVIHNALLYLKNCSKLKLVLTICKAFLFFQNDSNYKNYLQRMKLDKPKSVKNFIYKKILKFIINYQSKHTGNFYE